MHKHTESGFWRFGSRYDLNPIPTFQPLFPAFVTTQSAAFLGGSPPSNTLLGRLKLRLYSIIANKRRICYALLVDEGRKRVLLIAASILAARKLAQNDGGKRVPATVAAISDAVRWAEEIMRAIDERFPARKPDGVMR